MDRTEEAANNGDIWVHLVTGENKIRVASAFIPPFIKMPDVIVWGIRSFKKTDEMSVIGKEHVYAEVTCYCLPASTKIRVGGE